MFALDLDATQITALTVLNHNTVNWKNGGSSASSNATAVVYTEIAPDCRKSTLPGIIRGRVAWGSVSYSDGWRGYNGLVDVGYGKHLNVDHGREEFVHGRAHLNGSKASGALPDPASLGFVV